MMKKLGQELWTRVVLSYRSTLIGIAAAAGIVCIDVFTSWFSSLPKGSADYAAGLVLALCALFKKKLQEEVILPPAAPKGPAIAVLVAGSLLFAAPASAAGPGVICIQGCGGMGRVGAALGAPGDTQIASTVWAGPGLGVIPFRYNGATHEWSNPAAPAVSYGLWWRPPGYTATKSLAAVNLSLTGEFSGKSHIDPLVTLTLFDNFTIGGGPQINFETGGQRSGVNAVFAIGWQTSLGAP